MQFFVMAIFFIACLLPNQRAAASMQEAQELTHEFLTEAFEMARYRNISDNEKVDFLRRYLSTDEIKSRLGFSKVNLSKTVDSRAEDYVDYILNRLGSDMMSDLQEVYTTLNEKKKTVSRFSGISQEQISEWVNHGPTPIGVSYIERESSPGDFYVFKVVPFPTMVAKLAGNFFVPKHYIRQMEKFAIVVETSEGLRLLDVYDDYPNPSDSYLTRALKGVKVRSAASSMEEPKLAAR